MDPYERTEKFLFVFMTIVVILMFARVFVTYFGG